MAPRKKIPKKSSKSDCKREMDLDRISNLPDVVTDQILSYLPIKDTVKTSLLSSKWRYKWATIPSLVFDDQSLPLFTNRYGVASTDRLVSDIDRVLFLHFGPIYKFELSYEKNLPSNEIDKWVLYLSRHPIKEFVLQISNTESYKVPSCFFSCKNLTDLDLMGCFLKPPSAFKGFKNLKSLSLGKVKLDQDVFESLISSSPMLQNLSLDSLVGVHRLNINAPNLQSFELVGPIVDVSLKNTSRIAVFSVNATNRYNVYQKENTGFSKNLIELLADMPQIENLSIDGYSLEFLVSGVIPEALPVPCVNLRRLFFYINFTSFSETSTFLCLLRSAPNLQELEINCPFDEVWEIDNFWQADHWTCPFARLRHVKINYFNGIQAEIDFISFMLLTSPVLARMTITLEEHAEDNWDYGGYQGKFEMVKRLLCFKRASTQAEIIFMES